jgi:hypothetical protein
LTKRQEQEREARERVREERERATEERARPVQALHYHSGRVALLEALLALLEAFDTKIGAGEKGR